MPVRDEHMPLREVGHQVRRHEVRLPIEAGVAESRIQLRQPAANRHVRADRQDNVRVTRIRSVVNLVEDAPCGDHPHDGGLARTRGHLAGVTTEGLVAALELLLLTRFVWRDLDPLHKVAARLIEENDRFGCFELGKEEPEAATITPPVVQELQRRGRHARITSGSPLPYAGSNQADEFQLDGGALWNAAAGGILRNGIRVVVDRGPAAWPPLRLGSLFEPPMVRRVLERRADDCFGDFEVAHFGTRCNTASRTRVAISTARRASTSVGPPGSSGYRETNPRWVSSRQSAFKEDRP